MVNMSPIKALGITATIEVMMSIEFFDSEVNYLYVALEDV